VTGNEALRAALPALRAAGVEEPARDARHLLAHALGLPLDRLTLHLADPLSVAQQQAFTVAIAARARRRPVAQITGQRLFWGRSFRVTPDTLDPRPDTEVLIEAALAAPFDRVLDIGTGTGCILLTLLAERPEAQGLGTDISPAALAVAAGNAKTLGLTARAAFQQANWLEGVQGRYDLIVSNPPYIAQDEMAGLAPEVRDHEPHLALTDGADGLTAYRALVRAAPAALLPGGRLIFEIGPTQGQAVAGLLAMSQMTDIRVLPDMDGRDRVVMATAPG